MPKSATQNPQVKVLPELSPNGPKWDGYNFRLDTFVSVLQIFLESSFKEVTNFVANGTLVKHGMTIMKNAEHWQALSSKKEILGTWATPYVYPRDTDAAVAADTATVHATSAPSASIAEPPSTHTEPTLRAPSPPGPPVPDDVRFSAREIASFDGHLAKVICDCIKPSKVSKKLHDDCGGSGLKAMQLLLIRADLITKATYRAVEHPRAPRKGPPFAAHETDDPTRRTAVQTWWWCACDQCLLAYLRGTPRAVYNAPNGECDPLHPINHLEQLVLQVNPFDANTEIHDRDKVYVTWPSSVHSRTPLSSLATAQPPDAGAPAAPDCSTCASSESSGGDVECPNCETRLSVQSKRNFELCEGCKNGHSESLEDWGFMARPEPEDSGDSCDDNEDVIVGSDNVPSLELEPCDEPKDNFSLEIRRHFRQATTRWVALVSTQVRRPA